VKPATHACARYENWRPPVVGVSLLIPVGADSLAVADLLGLLALPTGSVEDGQTAQQAAQQALGGAPDSLPGLRYVALDFTQMRRRQVITHVLATAPMTREQATSLGFRDARATICVRPTRQVIDRATPRARLRVLVGLQALATGVTGYIEGDSVTAGPPPDISLQAARQL
jgi:hypothetical protein